MRICESIPLVLVGNKTDLKEEAKVKPTQVDKRMNPMDKDGKPLPPPFGAYFDLSAKTCDNTMKPWLHLARKLLQVSMTRR